MFNVSTQYVCKNAWLNLDKLGLLSSIFLVTDNALKCNLLRWMPTAHVLEQEVNFKFIQVLVCPFYLRGTWKKSRKLRNTWTNHCGVDYLRELYRGAWQKILKPIVECFGSTKLNRGAILSSSPRSTLLSWSYYTFIS